MLGQALRCSRVSESHLSACSVSLSTDAEWYLPASQTSRLQSGSYTAMAPVGPSLPSGSGWMPGFRVQKGGLLHPSPEDHLALRSWTAGISLKEQSGCPKSRAFSRSQAWEALPRTPSPWPEGLTPGTAPSFQW